MTGVAVTNRCQRDGKIAVARSDLVGVTGFEPVAPRSQGDTERALPSTTCYLTTSNVSGCRPLVGLVAVRLRCQDHERRPATRESEGKART